MKCFVSAVIVAVVVSLLAAGAAPAALLVYDDFNRYSAGTKITSSSSPWLISGSSTLLTATIVDSGDLPAGSNIQMDISDNDLTRNCTTYCRFPAVTSGTVTAQFDVKLAQQTCAFGTRLYDGSTPTNTAYCASGLVFEGNVAYAAGGGSGMGTMAYQPTGTTYSLLSGTTYTANSWYTVKVIADITNRTYRIFFGPKGTDPLPEVTPNPGTGVPFWSSTINKIGGITFFTSIKNAPETSGTLSVDNLQISGDYAPLDVPTVEQAKTTAVGTMIRLTDKIVIAGTEQMTGNFFYIQQDGVGIRVRPYPAQAVHQGDKVTLTGVLQRASDNGTPVKRNGEKEIAGPTEITVTPGPFALPRPVALRNRFIGGGPYGPIDPDTYVAQPGVYASGTTSQVSETGLNNVGMYARVFGKVVYADIASHYFYIDDGSAIIDGSTFGITGVRAMCRFDVPLGSIEGKYVLIPCIIGSIASGQLVPNSGVNNVRIIRPVEEPYVDADANGQWDPGETFTDYNGNGTRDGIISLP